MTRPYYLMLSVLAMMLNLTSCSENLEKVSKSPNGQLTIYEGRKYGAGIAPDSVKVYISPSSSAIPKNAETVFEGQDVGRICYNWLTPSELNISISGGYVDQIASQWQISDGVRVKVRYVGTSGCVWRRAK